MSQNDENLDNLVDWDSMNNTSNADKKAILEQRQRAKDELIEKYGMTEHEAENTLRDIERKAQENKSNNLSSQKQKEMAKKEINKQQVLMEKRKELEKLEIQKQKEQAKSNLEDSSGEIKLKDSNQEVEENNQENNNSEKLEISMSSIENNETSDSDENLENPEDILNQFKSKTQNKSDHNTFASEKDSGSSESSSKDSNSKLETSKSDNSNSIDNKSNDSNEIIPEHARNKEKSKSKNVDDLISNILPDENKELSIEVKDVSLSFEVATEKIDNLKEYFIRTLKRNKDKKRRFNALNDISFNIYKGDKVGIIGFNGAGKSTLLNVITGIYPPEKGEVKTYGKISPLLALGAGFDHNYSGRENIFLNGAILGYEKEFVQAKYDEIVEFSELEDFIDLPVKNYSSGMMAKLGFSIATIVEPDILIIDEVLGVGDVNFQKKSSDKIRSLMDSGTTVLLVSHSIPQIRQLCDKAIWIDQGNLREFGEVNEVCNHYLKEAEKANKEQIRNIRFR